MSPGVSVAEASFEVSGSQARDFLHRMLTQEVKGMKTGDVRPAFLLTREGRPVALFLVRALADRFLMTCDATAAPAARAHLERYVIADDVAIGDAVTQETPGPSDARRVEEGVAAWGAEIDGRVLPTETGPMGAISTTKGCYPGQEPVVMSLHRGHPPTRLCRLSIEGNDVPARDAPLSDGARGAGRVTTGVATPAGVRALALVRYDVAKEGSALLLASGAGATVTQVLV